MQFVTDSNASSIADSSDTKTASNKIAEALRQSEQKYRDLIENGMDLVFSLDLAGNFIYVSPQAKKILGYEPQELLGTSSLPMTHPDDVPHCMIAIEQLMQGKPVFDLEYRGFRKDGTMNWYTNNLAPVFDPTGEQIVGIQGITRLINQQKQAEAELNLKNDQLQRQTQELAAALTELKSTQLQLMQSEKMSALGKLVAGVAHEINNPVSFIYGNLSHASAYMKDLLYMISLYQQHCPNPPAQLQSELNAIDLPFVQADLAHMLDSMKNGAERIKQIVLSLRNFSRMDESEIKTVDLHDGLDSTLMMMEHLWKGDGTGEAKIKIHRNYGDLPPINCYAGEINQAFMHLLNNAIDALQCPNLENPQIWIETAPVLGSQAEIDRVTVTIRDNGVGIAETIRQQIFDPFFTTKPVGQGTGMGLALSYQIVVQRHSGQLEYQPNQPQGSAFSITIPTTLT